MDDPGLEGGALPATFDTSRAGARTGVLRVALGGAAETAAARGLAPTPLAAVFSLAELPPPPRRSNALYS